MGGSRAAYLSESSNRGTPYHSWDEVWTLNGLAGVLRADRVFMMDDLGIQEERAKRNPYVAGMLETAKRLGQPVYTARIVEGYPDLIEYPLQEVASKLNLQSLYLTNSVPYMVALAIAEGATKIGIYGCDYTYGDGRTEKGRACLEWWCGFAAARGVEVVVPASSSLLEGGKAEPYGYWAEDVTYMAGVVTRKPKPMPTAAEVEAKMAHTKAAP